MLNRLHNIRNPFQGSELKVLCVCSAGLLRSPTMASVLAQDPYNFNTRAAGVDEEWALIPLDFVLVSWADKIICASPEQRTKLLANYKDVPDVKEKTLTLNIPDIYERNDPSLIKLIKEQVNEITL